MFYNQRCKQHGLEKSRDTHNAEELQCAFLVTDKVQEIHRFWKSRQVHLAVTISKSYMTWTLAVCRAGALPRICPPSCIKIKSDTENCAVFLWVFVKLEHSLDFVQSIQAVQFLFRASSDLCTSCFNSIKLSAGSYNMLPWAYQCSAFMFPSFREQCSATHELQSPQEPVFNSLVLCSFFSAGDFLQKWLHDFSLRHQLFHCSKVLSFNWKLILVTGYSSSWIYVNSSSHSKTAFAIWWNLLWYGSCIKSKPS